MKDLVAMVTLVRSVGSELERGAGSRPSLLAFFSVFFS